MTKDTGKVLIHGKEYETVASRVSRFREEYKDKYSIVTEIISVDEKIVIMKASIKFTPWNEDGLIKANSVIATGHAEESRTSSQINRTSALENCETSAIGRALAAFGLAGTEFASADEVAQAISQQGDSTAPKLTGMATDKQRETIKKHLSATGISMEEQPGYLIETYGVEIPLTKEGASFVIGELFSKDDIGDK